MEAQSVFRQTVKIAFVVSLYWFVSITMVFLNKQLLKSEDLGLDAPFFVTFFQCFVSVILCQIVTLVGRCRNKTDLPSLQFDQKASREVLPVSLCFIAMIFFNNLCLRDLGVAFYNVGRSLTTLFNVILSYFVLKKTTPPLALLCCAGIVFGYLLGINTEGELVNLSYSGVFYGAVASCFVSLNAIMTSRVLPSVGNSPWKLGYYNNLNACFILLPCFLLSPDLHSILNYPKLDRPYFWFTLIVVGCFGLLVGFVSTWQIQVTTALTHNISGTAKACVQTILAVTYYRSPKTALWWLSNLIVLIGSFLYAVVRGRAMKQKVQLDKDQNDEKV